MSRVGVGIESNGEAQLAYGFFRLVIHQEGFAEHPVLSGTGGILANRQFQLSERVAVILFRHVSAGQTTASLLPLGMLAIKLTQFDHGSVEVAFVAVGVAQ